MQQGIKDKQQLRILQSQKLNFLLSIFYFYYVRKNKKSSDFFRAKNIVIRNRLFFSIFHGAMLKKA